MKCGWVFFLTRNTASCHYDQSEVTIVYIVACGSLGKFCLTGSLKDSQVLSLCIPGWQLYGSVWLHLEEWRWYVVNTCMPAHQGAHSIPTTCVNPYSKLRNYQTYYGNMNT